MTIEKDFYDYLKADVPLRTLLGASVADCRIYPLRSPQSKTGNYIVFMFEGEGGTDEILSDVRLVIKITTPKSSYTVVNSIRDRILTLLDKQDQINITSTINYIYFCKLNGTSDLEDAETEETIKVLNFDIKFQRKTPVI